jgi:hypothetical protein
LKLKCDEPLSNVAFNFNLRHYTEVAELKAANAAHAHAAQSASEAACAVDFLYADDYDDTVGRCRLTVSKPELKARLVSALETKM